MAAAFSCTTEEAVEKMSETVAGCLRDMEVMRQWLPQAIAMLPPPR
jgi:hypothetical protein